MIFAIDFDGTLCVDRYPEIGEPREDVIALYGNNCRKVFADGYIDDRNVRDLLGVEI